MCASKLVLLLKRIGSAILTYWGLELAELRKEHRARHTEEFREWLARKVSCRKAQKHPNAGVPGAVEGQPSTAVEKGISLLFSIQDDGKH